MVATTVSIFLGVYLTIICILSLVLNFIVLYVLYKGKFIFSGHNPIYILVFATICGNVLMCLIYGIYFGPSCISQVCDIENNSTIG